MNLIEFHCGGSVSKIIIGDLMKNALNYFGSKRVIILTDKNVSSLYKDQFPECPVIEIGTGESAKTLATADEVYKQLIELEADRSTFLLGIGGGIVTDMTGFIGATYMRGLDYGFVASTLLAQVDAAIGGKNGVNFSGYKNLIGTIRQPRFVICDPNMLLTLPDVELRSGLAEIVKAAAIRNYELFSYIEANIPDILALDPVVMERIIYESIQIKMAIVSSDEKEMGKRRKLNFGHTFGHAIEKLTGIPHGEAVSIGMALASDLSVKRHFLPLPEADRLKSLLKKLGLPITINVRKEQIMEAIRKDKKREQKMIHFVLLQSIGSSIVENISLSELEDFVDDMC